MVQKMQALRPMIVIPKGEKKEEEKKVEESKNEPEQKEVPVEEKKEQPENKLVEEN